jgi:proline racemase
MKARQIVYTWDYHHGQATRVILGGLPPLPGRTMAEKQASFVRLCDPIRTSLMREPRGHANMLGAVVTEPASPDADVGLIFLSPHGFFEMCGDSAFSAVAALVDAGIISYNDPDGDMSILVDTLAGQIDVHVDLRDGEPLAITFRNVPSYDLGATEVDVPHVGRIPVMLGYGGLTYAFIEAQAAGISSLKDMHRDELLDIGTLVLQNARDTIWLPDFVGPERVGEARPVDLITLWEPLEDTHGTRVANFYAPRTCGRTPSGTGLSARTAIEVAAGRLKEGDTFVHESLLGLRFVARLARMNIPRSDGGPSGCVPSITARSFLMGMSQWVLNPEDPFQAGFEF